MTDEQRCEAIAHELARLRGEGRIALTIDPVDAFNLIALLQLACRHPAIPETQRKVAEHFVLRLSEPMASCPSLVAVIREGWESGHDRVVLTRRGDA